MQIHRVLLVEDDFIINMDIREHLTECGYVVETAYCASAAIENLDRGRRVSALVTDIELGDGADGFAVARHARTANPGLPVVYISATSAARHGAEGVAGSAFVGKPLHPREVVAALRRLMDQPVPDPEALRLPTSTAAWPGALGVGRIGPLRRRSFAA